MATPKLQGLAEAMKKMEHGLEEEAGKLMTKVVAVDARGHAAIAVGHRRVDGKSALVDQIEKYVSALEGSNGGDPLDDSSDTSGQSEGEMVSTDKSSDISEQVEGEVAAGTLAEPHASWSKTA